MQKQDKPHIVIGMSGGVDSSVAALLLKEQGYRVTGLFMNNWRNDDPHCPASQDLIDAKNVCAKLNITLQVVDFSQTYWDRVFSHFLDEYQANRTPNPDVLCNKEIKFRAFLDYARQELHADAIATGHYVRVRQQQSLWQLLKARDNNKDQSYFLYLLDQSQLAHSLFPIGDYLKTEIRNIAQQAGFINHNKKDSTGICFIGERKFKDFLSHYLLAKPGAIETDTGQTLGQHDGLIYYTIGQRQGLKIGGVANAAEQAWYVLAKDVPRNVLIVGQGAHHPQLFATQLLAEQLHWQAGQAPTLPLQCTAKIRYRQADQPCQVIATQHDQYVIQFNQAQRAITPGQAIVFYADEVCLGGGTIIRTSSGGW